MIGGLGYLLRSTVVLVLPDLITNRAYQSIMQVSDIMILGEVPVIAGLLWLGFRTPGPGFAPLVADR